ncbi:hypothetical protein [Methylobacterium sp. J-068]|uniref:hypothetical protein n=1 Tax=Methylobacterium sp. J-068 TaxID=2836649 RepID=UPI001FBAAD68|nr:hypothetical protein [Methylobacterium sp. J-068]MCJ2033430.1 hypothetical protein [Methylobacterium sp. J-068]
MIVALILLLGGVVVGLSSRVMLAFGLSGIVLALSILSWMIRAEVSALRVLVLFAHLAALQAGYLLGAYLRTRGGRR